MPDTSKILIGAAGLIVVAIAGYMGYAWYQQYQIAEEKRNVEALVVEFGTLFKSISLQQDAEALKTEIQNNYAKYITEDLLNQWRSNPKQAPGRLTSSPWPDRLEVESVTAQGAGYNVFSDIIMMTSTGVSGNLPATAIVLKENGEWKIAVFQIGQEVKVGQ